MTDEPASKMLFAASAIMEMLEVKRPIVSFAAKSITFEMIPTIPAAVPHFLLFSGDLSQRLKHKDFPEIAYTDVDLFVCEMAHFNLDDARGYLEKCKAKRVFFNHIKEIYENDVKSENASGKFPFPMNVPSDGEEIEL